MHIVEGMLSAPVLATGAVLTAGGVAVGLHKTDYEHLPRIAVLSAAFFVASLIHVPVGPTSVHLVLNGLVGIILGWAVFPAMLIALLLQAIMFGFGGLTSLGVNTLNMALPALVCYWLFGRGLGARGPRSTFACGAAAGGLAVVLSAVMVSVSLYASNGDAFTTLIKFTLLAHVPIIIIEALVTGSVVVFLKKVRPELLSSPACAPIPKEAAHVQGVS